MRELFTKSLKNMFKVTKEITLEDVEKALTDGVISQEEYDFIVSDEVV